MGVAGNLTLGPFEAVFGTFCHQRRAAAECSLVFVAVERRCLVEEAVFSVAVVECLLESVAVEQTSLVEVVVFFAVQLLLVLLVLAVVESEVAA